MHVLYRFVRTAAWHRSLFDTGPNGVDDDTSTVVIAFNSNQVKDAYNLNPTEDDDFRYSFADEVAHAFGLHYNTTGKYWKPDFDQAEWNLWNRMVKREVTTTDQYVIDDSTKWLYAEEKGARVFGLYSTNDPEDPTLLYASKGHKADREHRILTGVQDEGAEIDGTRGLFARVVAAIKRRKSSGAHADVLVGNGGAAAGDVRVSVGEREGDRGADPVEVQTDPQLSLADDLTPELREEFVKSFDAQFGEGAAETMFKTHEQMKRAKSKTPHRIIIGPPRQTRTGWPLFILFSWGVLHKSPEPYR